MIIQLAVAMVPFHEQNNCVCSLLIIPKKNISTIFAVVKQFKILQKSTHLYFVCGFEVRARACEIRRKTTFAALSRSSKYLVEFNYLKRTRWETENKHHKKIFNDNNFACLTGLSKFFEINDQFEANSSSWCRICTADAIKPLPFVKYCQFIMNFFFSEQHRVKVKCVHLNLILRNICL